MTSDETQIQMFANWPMPHAKRVTRYNRKNPEYRVVEYNIMQYPQILHEKFDHFQRSANNTQHVATHRNTVAKRTLHVHNNVAMCCVKMLRSFGRSFSFSSLTWNPSKFSKLALANQNKDMTGLTNQSENPFNLHSFSPRIN